MSSWSRDMYTHAARGTARACVKQSQLQTRCSPHGPLLPPSTLPWRRKARTRRSSRACLSVLLGVRKEANNVVMNLSQNNNIKVQRCGLHPHRPHRGVTLRPEPVPLGARATATRLKPVPLGARASAGPRRTRVLAVMFASRPNLERPHQCGRVQRKVAHLQSSRGLCLFLKTWRHHGPRPSHSFRTQSLCTASSNNMRRAVPSPR